LSQVRNAHGVLEENLAEEFPVLAERFFDEVESALVQLDQERAVSPKVA
jgi:hypothetical protein